MYIHYRKKTQVAQIEKKTVIYKRQNVIHRGSIYGCISKYKTNQQKATNNKHGQTHSRHPKPLHQHAFQEKEGSQELMLTRGFPLLGPQMQKQKP